MSLKQKTPILTPLEKNFIQNTFDKVVDETPIKDLQEKGLSEQYIKNEIKHRAAELIRVIPQS